MPKKENIVDIVSDSLNAVTEVGEAIKKRQIQGSKLSIDKFDNTTNMLNNPNLQRNIEEHKEFIRGSIESLIHAPIDVRVKCQRIDESGKRSDKIYYVTRTSTPSLDTKLKLTSYRSPIGRIASLKAGSDDFFETPQGEIELKVENSAKLNPVKVDGNWDSVQNRIDIESERESRLDSMLEYMNQAGSDASETDVAEVRGSGRKHRDKVDLPYLNALDEYQDRIFRIPINRQCFLSGPPGAGKTTTLVIRLGQKTDMENMAEYRNEYQLIESFEQETGKVNATSWLLFSPTKLLREYIKNALKREEMEASDENIPIWYEFRSWIAQDYLDLLKSEDNSGQFNESDDSCLFPLDSKKQRKWCDDFNDFLNELSANEFTQGAKVLAESENAEAKILGSKLLDILRPIKKGAYVSVIGKLVGIKSKLHEMNSKLTDSINQNLSGVKSDIARNDARFNEKLIDQVKMLLSDSENEIEKTPDEKSAIRVLNQALRALAMAKVTGRAIPKKSRNGLMLEWLGNERLPGSKVMIILGKLLHEQNQIRKFINFEQSILGSIAGNYKKFRKIRAKKRIWYRNNPDNSSEISGPEIDLLILTVFRLSQQMLNFYRRDLQVKLPNSRILRAVKELQWSQILVDEATDYSIIQLACMYELAHPSMRSIFMCGDFNQRLSTSGAKSITDLKWIHKNIQEEAIDIPYRQSQNLVNLAKSVAEIGKKEVLEIAEPDRMDSNDIKPIWQENLSNFDEIADWLTKRIAEMYSKNSATKTIGVLVNNEPDAELLVKKLNERLNDTNMSAVACNEEGIGGNDQDIRVFDIAHIKGLEFEAVFFINLDETIEIYTDLFTNYLFVGATRASTFLGITFRGEIPLQVQTLESHFGRKW